MPRKDLSGLEHTIIDMNSGGEIMVLDTGAIIDAESQAMLQALHSRSTGGFRKHLAILEEKGPDKFIESFYVGYDHKSIGDCGTTSIFVEGVSMLTAKAIQDNPLYSGQEASTRYVDFSRVPFMDPTETKRGHTLLESQRAIYLDVLEPIREYLREKYPKEEREKISKYQKAINARAFDIARSLLPAGASTNLSWHTNLRQAADKMLFLRHHPHSFGHKKYHATEEYQEQIARSYLYHDLESPGEPEVDMSNLDRAELEKYSQLFYSRPPKTDLPKFLGQIGNVGAKFTLDFGSFRDVQRHRAINQRMPLLTPDLGFNEWYLTSMPESVVKVVTQHLEKLREGINDLGVRREDAQYFLPMGYNTSNRFTGDLPATIYMVELRDSRFVHPTLQIVAHSIGTQINDELGIPIHVDKEPHRFDVKRGEHDITLK